MSFLNFLNNIKLSEKYEGAHPSCVLYANLPASKTRLAAKFRDCEVRIKDLKILDSFAGFSDGNSRYISLQILEDTIEEASKVKAMTVKVIYPHWSEAPEIPLPPYRYEMTINNYVPQDETIPYGASDWYYLKLIWFDDAPSPDKSLADYINSITSQLDFFSITKKLSESEKKYWC